MIGFLHHEKIIITVTDQYDADLIKESLQNAVNNDELDFAFDLKVEDA